MLYHDKRFQKDPCFPLIAFNHEQIKDHLGGHVKGSITSKKYMRNEIWSLISFRGAPSWYITLSPADNKHPISLYYADTKEEFTPIITEKDGLIADNPVASA